MGLLDLFRRAPAIRAPEALADFIDERSAFLVQKGIYEYTRARAGPFSRILLVEPAFIEEIDRARWQAYPLGLAMVGELVEGMLRPDAGERQADVRDGLNGLVLSVFDRYPRPPQLDAATWSALREELQRRLDRIGSHPVKPVKDIAEPFWDRYFKLMPVHEKLRSRDEGTTRAYLQLTLINIHDDLTKRLDAAVLVEALRAEVR